MNVLIVGCGKLGSRVAKKLDAQGHEVSIVAEKQSDKDALVGFNGFTTVGIAIDEDVLIKAGIQDCDVAIIVTDSDNVNMMVSQMAKIVYNVKDVKARASEMSMTDLFKNLGIKIISTTEDSTNKICDSLLNNEDEIYTYVGKTTLATKIVDIDKRYIGIKVLDIPIDAEYTIYGILNNDGYFTQINSRKNIIVAKNDRLVINRVID